MIPQQETYTEWASWKQPVEVSCVASKLDEMILDIKLYRCLENIDLRVFDPSVPEGRLSHWQIVDFRGLIVSKRSKVFDCMVAIS